MKIFPDNFMRTFLFLIISLNALGQNEVFKFKEKAKHNIENSTSEYQRKIIDRESSIEIKSFDNNPYSIVDFLSASLILKNQEWNKVILMDATNSKPVAQNFELYVDRIKIISILPLSETYFQDSRDREMCHITVYIVIQDGKDLSYVRGSIEAFSCAKIEGKWIVYRLPA